MGGCSGIPSAARLECVCCGRSPLNQTVLDVYCIVLYCMYSIDIPKTVQEEKAERFMKNVIENFIVYDPYGPTDNNCSIQPHEHNITTLHIVAFKHATCREVNMKEPETMRFS